MPCSKIEIGNRIASLRNACGISQQALSSALNVSREIVAKWENGTRDIKTEHTIALADYFNVTCDYLLRGIEAERVDIHKLTGLSEDSIKALSFMKKPPLGPDIEKMSFEELNAMVIEDERKAESRTHGVHPKTKLRAINFLIENGNEFIEQLALSWFGEFEALGRAHVSSGDIVIKLDTLSRVQDGEVIFAHRTERMPIPEMMFALRNKALNDIFELNATKELYELTKKARAEKNGSE